MSPFEGVRECDRCTRQIPVDRLYFYIADATAFRPRRLAAVCADYCMTPEDWKVRASWHDDPLLRPLTPRQEGGAR